MNRIWVRDFNRVTDSVNLSVDESFIVRSRNNLELVDVGGRHNRLAASTKNTAHSAELYVHPDLVSNLFIVRNRLNEELFSINGFGYPYLSGGRIFHISADFMSVDEYSKNGHPLHRINGQAHLSSLDASPVLLAAGFLDGSVILDTPGQQRIVSPVQSRYPAVYGVAVGYQEAMLAVISGLEPQMFSVYGSSKKDGEYARFFARVIDTDFRSEVFCGFYAEDRYFVMETALGAVIMETDTWTTARELPMGRLVSCVYLESQSLFVLTDTDGYLHVVSPESRFHYSCALSFGPLYAEIHAGKLFVLENERLFRIGVCE